MAGAHTRPIVAAVDGSDSARAAVRWAAREAARRKVPLKLVHVCSLVPAGYQRTTAGDPDLFDRMLDEGRGWLREATGVAAAAGAVKISTELRNGQVSGALVQESASARLVVLGSRGLGGFSGLVIGSVAVALTAHGHCPIVVLPSSTMDSKWATGPVVVGVDGSSTSEAAVAFAFDAASTRGVPLVAVHAWLDINMAGAWTPLPMIVDWEAVRADEERVLAERLAGWQEKYPEVEVRRVVTKDRPVHALLEQGGQAQLVVVGSRGRGGFLGLGLGSVSQALLHRAEGPVAVVRPEKAPDLG
jgi:nucleotide-binding universal stress UspA family protein